MADKSSRDPQQITRRKFLKGVGSGLVATSTSASDTFNSSSPSAPPAAGRFASVGTAAKAARALSARSFC